MKKNISYPFFLLFVLALLISCDQGPKIIPLGEALDEPSMTSRSGVFDADQEVQPGQPDESDVLDNKIHTVKVEEVLPTDKYVYLKVTENGEMFWIATTKTDVSVGASYIYRGSVKQTYFKSREYNRTFEEVYFVGEIIPVKHGMDDVPSAAGNPESNDAQTTPGKVVNVKGSVRIADLVANPQNYGGKTIQLSGQCVKVNPDIMGRNWIHLKDGSQDDFDLVVTSDQMVDVGAVVTMTGVVGLDRDFGAGYRYSIIVEGGVVGNGE